MSILMTTPAIAVQLYSVRDHLDDKAALDQTLDRIAALGVGAVEPFTVFDDRLADAFARAGLAAPTAHSPFLSDELELGGRTVPLPPVAVTFEAARALGVTTLIDPMVPAGRWRTSDDVARTAERANRAAEQAAGLGLRLGYHNHSFEFHAQVDGRSAYEYFVSLLDDRVVLEVDVFWAAVAGQDVPALLRRLGDRVVALHVKDGVVTHDPFAAAGRHDGQSGGYDAASLDQRPAGQGELPLGAILDAAPGRELDVVEYDHAPGDAFAAVDASVRWLRSR